MSKVHQPSPGPPAPRSRSDSFVRMLELEKMCKMKRILRDHGSPPSTSNTPRATSPSVTANPPAPRSRRASDYPPLSHQTQIMKAVRRSAALPSLSLSIPPSPAPAMMRSEGSVEELSLAEERTKTVTFSEPEDEQLSDDSSICQSPSWEQYGQKKQKKKKQQKKGIDQKSMREKEDTALKRKTNRLSKLPPKNPLTARPLTVSDRSISVPELCASIQSNKMNPYSLTAEAQVAFGKQQTPGAEPGPMPKDKRKSKGFLAGLRLQHGNVAAVQKIVEARKNSEKGPEKGVDEDEPLRSIQYETIPVQQPIVSKPRKAPSIRSVMSTSDHSLSSQEKRNSGVRTSTGSGHGRSQSLLSSTLNKLRGPSYLYHQPSGDGPGSDSSMQSENLQVVGAVNGNLANASNDQAGKDLEERNLANQSSQQVFDFAFPPKPTRVNTEPGPDIAPRARQPRPRKADIQSPTTDQEIPVLRPSSGRRVQIEAPRIPARDTIMAMVAAQERQALAAQASLQPKSSVPSSNLALDISKAHRVRGEETDGERTDTRSQRSEIHQSRKNYATAISTSSIDRANERGKVASSLNRNDNRDMSKGNVLEDDQASVDTYASTIRPIPHSKLSPTDSLESRGCVTVPGQPEVRPETGAEKSFGNLITFERDIPDALQQPLQPHRQVDYFTSFSESYLPPRLNLGSPNDGQYLSPQLPFPEESDIEGEHDMLLDHFRTSHTKQTAAINEGDPKPASEISLNSKKSSGTSSEQRPKNSPAISAHHSDSDVPAFERLGLSSKVAKILAGAEMGSTSTGPSIQTDPSRTTSERSSSSTCDDSPPSPSSATTPDSSRPQSRKGAISQLELSQTTLLESLPRTQNGASRTDVGAQLSEQFEEAGFPGTKTEVDTNGSDWIEAAIGAAPKQPVTAQGRAGGVVLTPSLAVAPTLVSFADVLRQDLDEEGELGASAQHPTLPSPPRAHSALDLRSSTRTTAQSLRPQRLHLKPNGMTPSVSLPSSPPPDLNEMPRKSALKMSRNNSTTGSEPSNVMSTGAAYLQEARRTAPMASASSSRALRPHFSQKSSSGSIKSTVSAGNRAEPLAKMLVECCNCHFFHDMPSRVYECMAKPDSVVEDKLLGVSAAITTMVRCPWCAHGMTTQCCSGYAAVVYLKEKLHGK
ncbi:hypothetical protein F5Y01DRAFT_310774 [Xylaria sp. FL0043]|nr:hypothetical protein F5Y01DRAFT_310774 [Xylaria sp. FL0043]